MTVFAVIKREAATNAEENDNVALLGSRFADENFISCRREEG